MKIFRILCILASVLFTISLVSARAIAQEQPAGQDKPGLLVLESFSTASGGFHKDEMTILKRFLPMLFASKYLADGRINVTVAIGDETEENEIENAVMNKKSYKNFEGAINIEGVTKIAKQKNTRLVFLSDIKRVEIESYSKLVSDIGDYKYYKKQVKFGIELSTFLYDVEKGQQLYNRIFTFGPIEYGNIEYDEIKTALIKTLVQFKDNSPINVYNDQFSKQMVDFLQNNLGSLVSAGITITQTDTTPLIFEALGIKPDENADTLILSAFTGGNDVRMFSYNKKQANFDTAIPFANVYDTIPKHVGDGVFVAAGDFDGDKKDELVVSAGYDIFDHNEVYSSKHGKFSGSYVKALKREGGRFVQMSDPITGFFDESKSGAYVATGDFNGDGIDELAVSQTLWYDTVKIFKYKDGKFDTASPFAVLSKTFNAADGYALGAYIAAGDFDGNGADELVISKIAKETNIKVFSFADGAPKEISNLKNLFENDNGGAYIAAGNFDGDKTDELLVSRATGQDHVKVYSFKDGAFDTKNLFAEAYDKYNQGFNEGVFITAGDFTAAAMTNSLSPQASSTTS